MGGCNIVAREGMFLVGCCSWLRSTLSSNRMLYADVLTAILQSSSEHTQHAQNTAVYVCSDEDCRIAVEISLFF